MEAQEMPLEHLALEATVACILEFPRDYNNQRHCSWQAGHRKLNEQQIETYPKLSVKKKLLASHGA